MVDPPVPTAVKPQVTLRTTFIPELDDPAVGVEDLDPSVFQLFEDFGRKFHTCSPDTLVEGIYGQGAEKINPFRARRVNGGVTLKFCEDCSTKSECFRRGVGKCLDKTPENTEAPEPVEVTEAETASEEAPEAEPKTPKRTSRRRGRTKKAE